MNWARSFGSLKWETGTKRFASALLLPISGKLSEIESSDQGSKVKTGKTDSCAKGVLKKCI